MEKFDLQKYLAEGKLFEERKDIGTPEELKSFLYSRQSDIVGWVKEAIENHGEENISWEEDIKQWIADDAREITPVKFKLTYNDTTYDGYDEYMFEDVYEEFVKSTYDKFFSKGRLLKEDIKDQFIDDIENMANNLASEIENELEDHKDKINEVAGVVGIIGYILLSNTVANMLSKMAKTLSTKYKWGKGEAAAKKIYNFTHKNEEAFKAPLRRVVGLFTKDAKKKKMITDILYAILILLMAGQAGGDAVGYIKKAGYLKGGLYGLKAAVKGTEVASILKNVVQDAVS